MSHDMSYTPVVTRDEQSDVYPSMRIPDLAPPSSSVEPRESFLLEDMTPQPSHSRHESTDTLLKHDSEGSHVTPAALSTGRKPHFLRPTMWMYEILSLSLAIFILAAITTVLAVYDGKPSPVVGGITLNTVVAFAATLFRICLMVPVTECVCQLTWVRLAKGYRPLNDVFRIDLASRGPWSSLQLLSKFIHG